MLKRSQRIQGRNVIQDLLKEGISTTHPLFVLLKKPNELGHMRYGVIVSKKLEKSAVKRNKKRRQTYEIIRLLEKESLVPKQPTFDIVLIARRPVPTASYLDLEQGLRALLTKLS